MENKRFEYSCTVWLLVVWLAVAATTLASQEKSTLAEERPAAAPPPRILGEQVFETPFTILDGHLIVVEARIGPLHRMKFAVDTGATHSVLLSDRAEGLEFARRPVRVVNLDHVSTEPMVEVVDFQLGPIRIPQLPMMVSDLAYLRETAPGLDGVLGLDVLRSRSFSIDFARRKITFGTPRLLRSSVVMESDGPYLAVEVRILDQPTMLVVDSGVPTILLYRDRMGERLPNVKIEWQIRGASLGGNASLKVVTLPRVRLNGTELDRRAVLLWHSPVGFLPGVDGYLALAALRAQRFGFDFERNLFSWE
jgi:predicted aspartyl protease